MSNANGPEDRKKLLALLLLWLDGAALRITIMSIFPVIATVRDELALNATQVGVLSSVGPALFAIAALGGSLLVARLGLFNALVGGLAIVVVGSALRGLSSNFEMLLATSMLMAAGVALMQPMMPIAVREWLPRKIPLGTAVYTNGLLVGEVLPVMLTIPLVLPLLNDRWRAALVFWALPIVAITIVTFMLAPRSRLDAHGTKAAPRKWMPDWHRGLVWRLGLLFCFLNALYFASNGFLPIYLASQGRSDLIGGALTALNVGQLPASFLLLWAAPKVERRMWPYIFAALLSLACVLGLVFVVGTVVTIVLAALLGFAVGGLLAIALTLPPLLCAPEDVVRTAAGTFTISYGGAVVIGVLSGVFWDASGVPAIGFTPIALCALGLIAIALTMRAKRELL